MTPNRSTAIWFNFFKVAKLAAAEFVRLLMSNGGCGSAVSIRCDAPVRDA
jgi:hypothetical protein